VRFSASSQTSLGTQPASYTMGIGSFLELKRLGLGIDHPHLCSAEIKEEVELYM